MPGCRNVAEIRVQRPLADTDAIIEALAAAAERLGIEAYLVGGFVRDRLRGVPGKDIDVVAIGSDGLPLLADVARHFGWSRPQHFERFGTGQIRGDGFIVEVVRARSERYDPESRKPDVSPGTLEEDVWRRDFTVNALCQTFDGRIIDITGRGLDDLTGGVLRTPLDPDETFSEDPLRMLRCARFTAQLEFQLAEGVVESLQRQASRVGILSVERVTEELRRLLLTRRPSLGFEVLRSGGLLQPLLPELHAMIGVEQSGFHRWDVWGHSMAAVDAAPADSLTRLATLLHDVGKPPTHAVADDGRHTFHDHPSVGARMAIEMLTRLRFSNDEVDAVARIVKLHLRPIQYEAATHSDSAVRRLIRDAGELRGVLLDVARADTAASDYPNFDNIQDLEERMQRLDAGAAVSRLTVALHGEEIMELAGGRTAGPWLGAVKRALEEAVLEGEIPAGDAQAERAWLQGHRELLDDGS